MKVSSNFHCLFLSQLTQASEPQMTTPTEVMTYEGKTAWVRT